MTLAQTTLQTQLARTQLPGGVAQMVPAQPIQIQAPDVSQQTQVTVQQIAQALSQQMPYSQGGFIIQSQFGQQVVVLMPTSTTSTHIEILLFADSITLEK